MGDPGLNVVLAKRQPYGSHLALSGTELLAVLTILTLMTLLCVSVARGWSANVVLPCVFFVLLVSCAILSAIKRPAVVNDAMRPAQANEAAVRRQITIGV